MSIEQLSTIWPEWKVVEKIGEGSFGKVYKVVREGHGIVDNAAVKVISIPQSPAEISSLKADGYDDASVRSYFGGMVTDFVNEIKLMITMKGATNIVSVEDYKVVEKTGEIGADIYIRMELLTSFADYAMGKKLSQDEVIKLGVDVCSALELCAKKNIIHRDIKPGNIFVSQFGDFKVGDFGVARELGKTIGIMSARGTPLYIAPEIEKGKNYDGTADIYSLGIVLYKLLNNNRMPFIDPDANQIFYKESKEAIDRRMSGETLPAPVGASPQMTQVVLKACEFDPAKRFKTAAEFKAALEKVKKGTYVSDSQPMPITQPEPELESVSDPQPMPEHEYGDFDKTMMLIPNPAPPTPSELKPTEVCSHCGEENKKGEKYCTYCGKKIGSFWQRLLSDKKALVILGIVAVYVIGVIIPITTHLLQPPPPTPMPPPPPPSPSPPPPLEIKYGNTPGNIVNGGFVAILDDMIFYSTSDYGIYRMKIDGSDRRKLNDDFSRALNVVGDRIYYTNGDDGWKIYSIELDGSNRQKLNNDDSGRLNVVEDRVYYINYDDGQKIYSIGLDGSDRRKLSNDFSFDINVVNDKIYYNNRDDDWSIYSIGLDGSDRRKVNDDWSWTLNVVNDKIYYTNYDDGDKIYSIGVDGNNRRKLNNDISHNLNVVDDRIYYSTGDDGGEICSMSVDGSDRRKLSDDFSDTNGVTSMMGIVGGWIFSGYNTGRYMIRIDGSDKQLIFDSEEPFDAHYYANENSKNWVHLTINWEDNTSTIFERDKDSEVWTMASRHGYMRIVDPTFVISGNELWISFPTTASQNYYTLYRGGKGRSTDEDITWEFKTDSNHPQSSKSDTGLTRGLYDKLSQTPYVAIRVQWNDGQDTIFYYRDDGLWTQTNRGGGGSSDVRLNIDNSSNEVRITISGSKTPYILRNDGTGSYGNESFSWSYDYYIK